MRKYRTSSWGRIGFHGNRYFLSLFLKILRFCPWPLEGHYSRQRSVRHQLATCQERRGRAPSCSPKTLRMCTGPSLEGSQASHASDRPGRRSLKWPMAVWARGGMKQTAGWNSARAEKLCLFSSSRFAIRIVVYSRLRHHGGFLHAIALHVAVRQGNPRAGAQTEVRPPGKAKNRPGPVPIRGGLEKWGLKIRATAEGKLEPRLKGRNREEEARGAETPFFQDQSDQ